MKNIKNVFIAIVSFFAILASCSLDNSLICFISIVLFCYSIGNINYEIKENQQILLRKKSRNAKYRSKK